MNLTTFNYLLIFISALILVGLLTPLMRVLAFKFEVLDRPIAAHKTHKSPIPYLGGVAIVLGVTLVTYSAIYIGKFSSSTLWIANFVVIPSIFMAAVGLLDDVWKLSPWSRFLVQCCVGLLSALILVRTETVGSPTGSKFFDIFLSILWIVGLTNSINFFDNLDGGASGTVAISSFFLFILAIQSGQTLISALSLVLVGSTLGFLIWNRPPARIYMGDAGSLFLGLLLASLTIRLEPNPINKMASFSVPFFLVAVPILDTSVVVSKRIIRGISPFQGGRDHLSHRLMREGFSKRQSVISLWLITFFFGAVSLVISNSAYNKEGIFMIIGIFIWTLFFFFFARLSDN